jgi:hypothetical protein
VNVYSENHRKYSGVGENAGVYFRVDGKYNYHQFLKQTKNEIKYIVQ